MIIEVIPTTDETGFVVLTMEDDEGGSRREILDVEPAQELVDLTAAFIEKWFDDVEPSCSCNGLTGPCRAHE